MSPMSTSSRRRARRIRHQRQEAARARQEQRLLDFRAGGNSFPFPSRKDRAILFPRAGRKQRAKHWQARLAARDRRHAAATQRLGQSLVEATATAPARVTSLAQLGGVCPMTAQGTAVLADGQERAWTFRIRSDRAFLEVGTLDQEFGLVDECDLAASWEQVTGDRYTGSLDYAQTLTVLTRLFSELCPPAEGTRHREQLASTLEHLLSLRAAAGQDGPDEQDEPVAT